MRQDRPPEYRNWSIARARATCRQQETEVQASDAVTEGAAVTRKRDSDGSDDRLHTTEVTTTAEVEAGDVITASEEVTGAADLDSAEAVTTTAESVGSPRPR